MGKFVIVKDGYIIIGIFFLITLIVWYTLGPIIAVIPGILTCFFAYFFRNPERPTPPDESLLYSPADGRVMAIEELFDDEYLNEEAVKV
ncbi:MAG: phosphatidylserine decarboxylase, partial [Acidaminococcaceae bacterium]